MSQCICPALRLLSMTIIWSSWEEKILAPILQSGWCWKALLRRLCWRNCHGRKRYRRAVDAPSIPDWKGNGRFAWLSPSSGVNDRQKGGVGDSLWQWVNYIQRPSWIRREGAQIVARDSAVFNLRAPWEMPCSLDRQIVVTAPQLKGSISVLSGSMLETYAMVGNEPFFSIVWLYFGLLYSADLIICLPALLLKSCLTKESYTKDAEHKPECGCDLIMAWAPLKMLE
jgi:hypothetical protein